MQSEAKTVNAYLQEVPGNRRAALDKIRELCRSILIGYEELMAYGGPTYGGPTYQKDKGIEIGFASQKSYIGFYCMVEEVMIDNKDLLKGLNHGKGVIRFANPDKIDFKIIETLLKATVNSKSNPC